MAIEVVAKYLSSVWLAVDSQAQVNDLSRSFSFPIEMHDDVREEMENAAAEDAEHREQSGVEIPEDPAAHWGKWHRAANIVNAHAEDWARNHGMSLTTGDWSWHGLLDVVGVNLRSGQ